MKKSDFVRKIFKTPCEQCPIQGYCKIAKTLSCTMTARSYFSKISRGKESVPWHTLEMVLNLGLTPPE